ncbi:hypothetical protein V4C53_36460 [Paraburkholderia azotifigens]|uniref:hypothetical protein n=1 Tax=Paraburkholderia azotifigens TaxID=2057004 RepID=UPI00317C9AF1
MNFLFSFLLVMLFEHHCLPLAACRRTSSGTVRCARAGLLIMTNPTVALSDIRRFSFCRFNAAIVQIG